MIGGLLEGAMGAALTGVVGGLLLWIRHRRLDAAQVDDTEGSAAERRANARKTDAEAWAVTKTGLVDDVKRLQAELKELRAELAVVRKELAEEKTARQAAERRVAELEKHTDEGTGR